MVVLTEERERESISIDRGKVNGNGHCGGDRL